MRLTRLVEASFAARDPKLAADCVNELSAAFIDLNINIKYAATEQATTFLSEQIKGLQTEIEQKEKELQGLEADANIIALSDTETTVIDRLSQLNKALTEAQVERSQKEATWNGLKNVGPDYVPEAISNPLIQRLREDYVRLKREYQKMEERFQPDYPELQRTKVELDSARISLADETQNLVKGAYSEYQTALSRERSLEAEFNEQKGEAFKMNSSAVLYNGLKVEIQNKKTLLDSLLRRESETGVEARLKGLRTSNIRVVDRARVPVHPSSPNKKRNLILALLLGLGGGVGLAFLFDFLDNSVKTSEDVERYAGLPTLGVVPKFSLEGANKAYSYGRRLKAGKVPAQLEAGDGDRGDGRDAGRRGRDCGNSFRGVLRRRGREGRASRQHRARASLLPQFAPGRELPVHPHGPAAVVGRQPGQNGRRDLGHARGREDRHGRQPGRHAGPVGEDRAHRRRRSETAAPAPHLQGQEHVRPDDLPDRFGGDQGRHQSRRRSRICSWSTPDPSRPIRPSSWARTGWPGSSG